VVARCGKSFRLAQPGRSHHQVDGFVVIAAVLSFVFKSSPASWPSTIVFWVIALALAVWIFTR
jgi:hypothetical protein